MTAITPDLAGVIRPAITARLRDIHVGMPGRVVRYDAERQCADVQPLVRRPYRDEAGERQTELLAIVVDVPVIWQGGGGFNFICPLEVGDDVWLSFASCELENWATTGGESTPESDRRFSLSDAVCSPGLRDLAHPRTSAPTDHARIGADEGAAIEFRTADIRIGGGAGHEATFKAEAFLDAFDQLISTIATAAAGTGGGVTTAIETALLTFHSNIVANAALTTIAKVK